MRNKLIVNYLLRFGLVALVGGCATGREAAEKKQPDRPVLVRTVAVKQAEIEQTTEQPATVHAFYRAEIRARASGYVRELHADLGDYVEAGAALAVIDVPEMQKQREIIESRIRRLDAEEQRAQAGVQLAAARVRSAMAKLSEARSQLNQVDASLAAAEAEFSRTSDLVQRQSIQERMLDEARKKRDSELASKQAMQSAIESAEAEVTVAEAMRVSARSDLEAAGADTEIARRELEELDVLLSYAELRAPFAGIVTHRNVEPGQLVRKESDVGDGGALFVVSQVDKVRVRIPVPEVEAPLVNVGDEITLSFPSFASEQPITGRITRIAGSLDPATRTMLVEAEIPNTEGKLIPGMFGQAKINLNRKVAANLLPARAVRFDESGNAFVYAVAADDTVTLTPVTTGFDNGSTIEIVAGIDAQQRVIDSHLQRFIDGQQVAVMSN